MSRSSAPLREHAGASYPVGMAATSGYRVVRRRQRLGTSYAVALIALVVLVAGGAVRLRDVGTGRGTPLARVHIARGFAGPPSVGRGILPARVLVEPGDGSRPLVRAIDRAQDRVFLEAYILTDAPVIRALERGAAQGVEVFVLLEPHAIGMGTQAQRMADELRAAGVRVRWTPASFSLTHAKFLVLDDREAIISTANFSRSAFHSNREFLAYTRDQPLVRQLSAVFRADWDRLAVAVRNRDAVVAPNGARRQLSGMFERARSRLDIYAEEIADARTEASLVRAARRHVRVRVILAAGQTQAAARYLAARRVRVRTLATPYVHAKVIVADGRQAFVGSENLSSQSLDRNREVGVVLRGPAVARIDSAFDRDWRNGTAVAP